MTDPIDISICIPTRNRAVQLEKCLEHLARFSAFALEVVVSDNASEDDTPNVIERFTAKMPRLRYLRHETDLGFPRNADTALRIARGNYLYLLSDDDIVIENDLVAMKALLDKDPAVAAVSATSIQSSNQTGGVGRNHGDVEIFGIRKGDFPTLADHLAKNILAFDGHPLMRREIFQRHCWFEDGCLGLLPLFTRLLGHGDLCFLSKPVFEHTASERRLSAQLPEHWMQDFYMADIEMAFADAPQAYPPDLLGRVRISFAKTVYFEAARRCHAQGNLPGLWHYLLRAKAVGGLDEACLLQCEIRFMAEMTAHTIALMIENMEAASVAICPSPVTNALVPPLRSLLPQVVFSPEGGEKAADLTLLAARKDGDAGSNSIAVEDVLDNLRLTRHRIVPSVTDGKLAFAFADPSRAEWAKRPSPFFTRLLTPYDQNPAPP